MFCLSNRATFCIFTGPARGNKLCLLVTGFEKQKVGGWSSSHFAVMYFYVAGDLYWATSNHFENTLKPFWQVQI